VGNDQNIQANGTLQNILYYGFNSLILYLIVGPGSRSV